MLKISVFANAGAGFTQGDISGDGRGENRQEFAIFEFAALKGCFAIHHGACDNDRSCVGRLACEVNLDVGSLMLLEPMLPYDARFSRDSKTLLSKVPRRELRARIGGNRELIGRRVTAERADDDLALSVAAKLPSLAGRTTFITEEMVGNHVLDLIGLSIARTIGSATVRVSNAKALLLGQIRSVVEARLADPELVGQKVADIVGISVRYANALLAEQDSSLQRLILSRRLLRCRFALEDPNQAHQTIAEIARVGIFGHDPFWPLL